MTIESQIEELLKKTEEQDEVSILYACESGSRAWGFASPNSDYDIRFLYQSSPESYLSVFESADTIEIPIKDDLDPGGWDIKKALGLLAKSNGALIEWLHSPIVYSNKLDFRERWQNIVKEVLSPRHLINHYKGLAIQITKKKLESDNPTVKGYLYASRALLAAKWVEVKHSPPPVPFVELMDFAEPELKRVLEETVKWKETADEVASKGRITEIDQFIEKAIDAKNSLPHLPEPDPQYVRDVINSEFRRLIVV